MNKIWLDDEYKECEFEQGDVICRECALDEESIIGFKVYSSCRIKECITVKEARAAQRGYIGDRYIEKGDRLIVPTGTEQIQVKELRIKRIIVKKKTCNKTDKRKWEISLCFLIEYRISFYDSDCNCTDSILASSLYDKTVTLLGSLDGMAVKTTDLTEALHCQKCKCTRAPYVLVEAKAELLSAELKKCRGNNAINITIGLVAVIKLFHIAAMYIESKGICVT